MAIHPLAVVGSGAVVGDGVEVGPFAVVSDDVVLGPGCVVMNHACIHGGVRLGSRCVVHPGAVLGGAPQNRAYVGQRSLLEVGSDTEFREYTTVSRGTAEGAATRIGSGSLLMIGAHVGHDCVIGDRVTIANAVHIAGHCEVHDGATIGGMTALHQFVRIGRLAMVGGDSGVRQDVPPFMLAAGPTSAVVYGLNRVGLARSAMGVEIRSRLKHAFRTLYRSNLNTAQAVERIRAEVPCDGAVLELVEFITASRRGLCAGSGRVKRPGVLPPLD